MGILDSVIHDLSGRRKDWPDAAKFADIHYRTLTRILNREIENPGVVTVERLAAFVKQVRQ